MTKNNNKMKKELFNLLDQINRHGIDNSKWGLVEDVPNTRTYFGTRANLALDGQWLYIQINEDDADWEIVESPNVEDATFTLSVSEIDGEFVFLYKL